MSVFLGDADSFLGYDTLTGTIYSLDPSAPIPIGDYRIIVTLLDDNEEGKRAREYYINIIVQDGELDSTSVEALSVADFKYADEYLVPKIASVSSLGELTLLWNKDVVKPSNETWFEEQLRRIVYTEDLHTNLKLEAPAFEVEFVQSYSHQESIKMEWEYVGWEGDREMKL